jgi:hypothetical protein
MASRLWREGAVLGPLSLNDALLTHKQSTILLFTLQSSPLVFGTLIDMKANSKNQADHLIITKAERQGLIDNINTEFGPAIDEKDRDYTVSGAAVIKAYLLKDYKSSDDPLE